MAKGKETPLIKQYNSIKSNYPDTVLLFRLGDFYETFNEDAVITAKVCGITLTKRNNGAAGQMPLAGFPHHQLDAYLPKLVKAGYRAAVCEQLEDPKQAKGIVKRGVTEIVTPGVALYDKLLESKKNKFLASVYYKKIKKGPELIGFAFADVSTGEFFTTDILAKELGENLEAVLPSEIIISKSQKQYFIEAMKKLSFSPSISYQEEWIFEDEFCNDALLKQFETKNLKGFGIADLSVGVVAAGVVIHYLNETQNSALKHINSISLYDTANYMLLDSSTRRNLEITLTTEGETEGSLFSALDDTKTPMGGRLLKKWISMPLKKENEIQRRLDAVNTLYDSQKINQLREVLTEIGDIERLSTKIATLRAGPRDLVALKNSMVKLPEIKDYLSKFDDDYLKALKLNIPDSESLVSIIGNALKEEPGINIGKGNVFNDGYSEELDEYITARYSAKNWISNFQKKMREATGINNLKVGFNNVFGYYIEVTKVNTSKVPDSFERKQTLTNSERYITPELKVFEEKIFGADEKIDAIEKKLYNELINKLMNYLREMKLSSYIVGQLDCLQSFAFVSLQKNYCKPIINDGRDLYIEDGRHPIVEDSLPPGESFTANDTNFNTEEEIVHIITGPNMSGKSSYLRQTAIIVLMAQIGCYVPAKKCTLGLVDKIYTRVGAGDNIRSGESTFLVEMQESANIMNNATDKSLILLDEVGRGTATFDGISIAWAIAEHIHNKLGAKTLFATHYHELNDLANRYEKIKNYKVEVVERDAKIIFTHKVKEGTADHSFGIYVAKMAGLPYSVVERSKEIMGTLEEDVSQQKIGGSELSTSKPNLKKVQTKKNEEQDNQLSIFAFEDDKLRQRLKEMNIEGMTPLQAFQVLAELISEAKT
ncbi:MAG: DNA mismatch repair protein MutS [Chlorobiota bacterium]